MISEVDRLTNEVLLHHAMLSVVFIVIGESIVKICSRSLPFLATFSIPISTSLDMSLCYEKVKCRAVLSLTQDYTIQSKKLSILSPIVLFSVLLGSIKSLAVCNTLEVNFRASVDCQRRTPITTTRTVFIGKV